MNNKKMKQIVGAVERTNREDAKKSYWSHNRRSLREPGTAATTFSSTTSRPACIIRTSSCATSSRARSEPRPPVRGALPVRAAVAAVRNCDRRKMSWCAPRQRLESCWITRGRASWCARPIGPVASARSECQSGLLGPFHSHRSAPPSPSPRAGEGPARHYPRALQSRARDAQH